jgi:hypothetical protein
MKKFKLFIGLLSAIAMASIVSAETGVGLKVGTLGVGIDVATSVFDVSPAKASVRVNGNYFSYSRDESLSDVKIDGKLKLQSVGIVGDWYPFSGSFRLSAGAYYNQNKVEVAGKPTGGSYTFNGATYTSAQVGTLDGRAKLGNSFAPYAGLGWGNTLGDSKRWGFFTEIGALFTGSPKLSLVSRNGVLSNDATFLSNLEQERRQAQEDINMVSVYPVVSIGVTYKF